MCKEKEIDNKSQNPYEGIDEKLVRFVKAIEFYGDYGSHLLCTENCKECKFQPLCEYRGSMNVNLALHLMGAGYGNIKQNVKEFSENIVKPIIDELVKLLFNDNESNCKVDCEKGSDIPCGSSICIEENKQYWKNKIDDLIEEHYGRNII